MSNAEIAAGVNPTGPLTFIYPIPAQPLARHKDVWGSWLSKIIGLDTDSVRKLNEERWSAITSPELFPLRDYLMSLVPVNIAVTDRSATVERSPKEQKESNDVDKVFEDNRSSRELVDAMMDGPWSLMFDPEKLQERENEIKAYYDSAYQDKLEEFSKLPPIDNKSICQPAWLTLAQPNSEALVVLPENPSTAPGEETDDFPWENHRGLREFLQFFGHLSVSYGLPSEYSGFTSLSSLELMRDLDGQYPQEIAPEWHGAIWLYKVGDGDNLVYSRTGKVGRVLHEHNWAIEESGLDGFGELISSFLLYCQDPDKHKESIFY